MSIDYGVIKTTCITLYLHAIVQLSEKLQYCHLIRKMVLFDNTISVTKYASGSISLTNLLSFLK